MQLIKDSSLPSLFFILFDFTTSGTPDSRFEARPILFSSRCLRSLGCINEYLALDRVGAPSLHNNCSVAEYHPGKSIGIGYMIGLRGMGGGLE